VNLQVVQNCKDRMAKGFSFDEDSPPMGKNSLQVNEA
jgi:hypothetical protein